MVESPTNITDNPPPPTSAEMCVKPCGTAFHSDGKYSFCFSPTSCQFLAQVKAFDVHLSQLCVSLDLSPRPSTRSLHTLQHWRGKKGSKCWRGAECSEDLSQEQRVGREVQLMPKKEEGSEPDCIALTSTGFNTAHKHTPPTSLTLNHTKKAQLQTNTTTLPNPAICVNGPSAKC